MIEYTCVRHYMFCNLSRKYTSTLRPINEEAVMRNVSGMGKRDRQKCGIDAVMKSMAASCCSRNCNRDHEWSAERR
jgi:hypothetical protein